MPACSASFVILDFANDPTVVHIEARTTGLFRDDAYEVALYELTVAWPSAGTGIRDSKNPDVRIDVSARAFARLLVVAKER